MYNRFKFSKNIKDVTSLKWISWQNNNKLKISLEALSFEISTKEKFNELGDIINDPSLGRKNKEDITICDLTGTGVQDTAIARFAYNLCKKNNLGINI